MRWELLQLLVCYCICTIVLTGCGAEYDIIPSTDAPVIIAQENMPIDVTSESSPQSAVHETDTPAPTQPSVNIVSPAHHTPTPTIINEPGKLPPQPLDLDGDGYYSLATGGTDCQDNDAAIHPGAEDFPTLNTIAIDRDCDGMQDGTKALGIFVAADATSGGNGSLAQPFRSIDDALAALDTANKARIYILRSSAPLSMADLTLPAGVELLGGYQRGAQGQIVRNITSASHRARLRLTHGGLHLSDAFGAEPTTLVGLTILLHNTSTIANHGADIALHHITVLRPQSVNTPFVSLMLSASPGHATQITVHDTHIVHSSTLARSQYGMLIMNNTMDPTHLNIRRSSVILGDATIPGSLGHCVALATYGSMDGVIADNTLSAGHGHIVQGLAITSHTALPMQNNALYIERNHITTPAATEQTQHIRGMTVATSDADLTMRNNVVRHYAAADGISIADHGIYIENANATLLNNTVSGAYYGLFVDAADRELALINNIFQHRPYGIAVHVESSLIWERLENNLFAHDHPGQLYRYISPAGTRIVGGALDPEEAMARINGYDTGLVDTPFTYDPTFHFGGGNLVGYALLGSDDATLGAESAARNTGTPLTDMPAFTPEDVTVNVLGEVRDPLAWHIGAY